MIPEISSIPFHSPVFPVSFLDDKIRECEQQIQEYWRQNPDLYQIVQRKKQAASLVNLPVVLVKNQTQTITTDNEPQLSLLTRVLRGAPLREKMRANQGIIRERILAMNADIIPRTAASNRKSSYTTLDEEREHREDITAAQIQAWRSQLPKLIREFSRIPDHRRAKSITHKMTVLMMFGLFSFIFRLSSRREMNRELTGPVIFEHLKKLFPEIDSIPHADSLARVLEKINPQRIEAIHIGLIKDLIRHKKFKKLLIKGCLPVTVDGTQKMYRNDLLQDARWCERAVGQAKENEDDEKDKQQYIYAIEANITLKNGLTIPLMTEYLYRENNQLLQTNDKQDSETTAFERLANRLKKYFPRLKMIFFMDAMYATQTVMGLLHNHHWEYIIRLPKNKLTDLAKQLNKNKSTSVEVPAQEAYRKRQQEFHWENDISYGYEWELTIHLAACSERYEEVDRKTGEIVQRFSEHAWISSLRVSRDNVHELFNLGARKKELIEDSMNTEKNRGYNYKHAFSYDWNAMQGFHYLMRLGHAINAISEFTKKLKKYIKANGVSATLKLIKETLFSPWLAVEFYEEQSTKMAQLRLQLE
jgi:hypothetical protein